MHVLDVLQVVQRLHLQKLRLDTLDCPSSYLRTFGPEVLSTLTSLRLQLGLTCEYWNTTRFEVIGDRIGCFANFPARLTHLESFSLELGGFLEDNVDGSNESGRVALSPNTHLCITQCTWPRLRKLSVRHLNVTPEAMLRLLERHSSTLRDLRLHNIQLEEVTSANLSTRSWPEVLQSISKILDLSRATLPGWLGGTRSTTHWLFADNIQLGQSAGQHIVQGGTCPLNDYNTTTVRK